jgi:hypothetical protein
MTENIKEVTEFEMIVSYRCPNTDNKTVEILPTPNIECETEDCHICGHHIKIYLDMKCGECGMWHEIIIRDDDPGSNSHRRHEMMEVSHESNKS